ncbi:hypothetical protein RJ640_006864 [Escallonia rubra]|uniref:DUF7950 domain-containing protein n=1 Tax=Escallonia rubra TaxID=112253 RepID=A0AA88RTY8_9ASTE|nr:hypothetical protein RJ640_006864 [Escallonia rubra]
MARYRPIAPKPEVPISPMSDQNQTMSPKIRQSSYLRDVWPNLQARPTRTRKRGRTALAPPAVKRPRICLQPYQVSTSPAKNLSVQGFTHCPNGLFQLPSVKNFASTATAAAATGTLINGVLENQVTDPTTLVTLPLLPCPSLLTIATSQPSITQVLNGIESSGGQMGGIDLNVEAEVPEEKDFLQQLQERTTTNVIAPQPVRPVGSSISIRSICDPGPTPTVQITKKAEEVEEEVETEVLPAVVSDSNNKVRLVNSAYKKMVGQPECSWLDSMVVTCDGGSACKRICGEVMLHFPHLHAPICSNGFSCWVRIEWGKNGVKSSIDTFCDAIRLSCESKDYLFAWKFHTREASESVSTV